MSNKKDIHAQERADYKSKIMQKERDLENFQNRLKSFEQSDKNFNNTLNSGYGKLRELQERDRQWDKDIDKEIVLNSQKASIISKLVHTQNDQIQQYFNRAKKQALNKIDELEKERRALPWD